MACLFDVVIIDTSKEEEEGIRVFKTALFFLREERLPFLQGKVSGAIILEINIIMTIRAMIALDVDGNVPIWLIAWIGSIGESDSSILIMAFGLKEVLSWLKAEVLWGSFLRKGLGKTHSTVSSLLLEMLARTAVCGVGLRKEVILLMSVLVTTVVRGQLNGGLAGRSSLCCSPAV